MKSARQEKIIEIISSRDVETQSQLIEELSACGIRSTQATLSRDIKELRLVKELTSDGKYRYVAASRDEFTDYDLRLKKIFRECVTTYSTAQNLLVIKTLPGLAPAACAALDGMEIDGLVGTLAGDDTAFLAMALETVGELPDTLLDFEDIQMLIHTGGTTGVPKAAMMSFRALFYNFLADSQGYQLNDSDSCILTLPLFHTAGWNVFTLPLLNLGGRIILMNQIVELLTKQNDSGKMSAADSLKMDGMLHSLLSSPCNFTPLLHFILPVQYDDTRSFAELWINPESDESDMPEDAGSGGMHILMVIDVDTVGRFEAEFYVYNNTVDFNLYCPKGSEAGYEELMKSMNYQPGDVSVDWDVSANEFNFIPGSIRMAMVLNCVSHWGFQDRKSVV